MKNKIVLLFAIAFSILTYSLSSCNSGESSVETEHEAATVLYQCPMDCEDGKTYAEPGQCPVCEMELEEVN